ncbi:hypothetical protein [Paenibacillus beijingensis]|uniref:Uncharacterized protein n=1 Tax=Paenibacillus beijingensis TaxID=1126833 RepID=A0A0D5NQA3_9BACL|nr:hypothetical protein [Paenibacillus beijingensis]AJY77152.1 hypothetical protein VN24_24640 [Paenibacillus beijingensis]
MNLADMLGYADIKQLNRIADAYRCECNGNSKNELIQSILSTVGRKEVFEAQIGSMKLEELRFINSLLFEKRNAFSLEELIARVHNSKFDADKPQASSAGQTDSKPAKNRKSKSKPKAKAKAEVPSDSPRDIIARFKHQGWLFNGLAGPDRYLFQVPDDLKRRFQETMRRRFAAGLIYTDEPSVYRDEQQLLNEDVLAFLRFVRHNEVPLTAEGFMYRRSIQAAIESFGVREDLPQKTAWRFGYGRRFREYPERMSLLYDYCYYNSRIEENDGSLVLTAAGEEWVKEKRCDEPTQLYRFWLRLYKGAIPNLLSFVHWIDALAGQWVTVDSLRSALTPYIKSYFYDTPDDVFDKRILSMMLHLGLLRIGEDANYGAVAVMTRLGKAVVAGVHVEHHDYIELPRDR